MKQFDLKEYLKDPNKKVVTRDGGNVRIICTDRKGSKYLVIALCTMSNGRENLYSYLPNGRMHLNADADSCMDLFFAPEKHEGWVNLYKNLGGFIVPSRIYQTKELAEKRGSWHDCYVTTTKIEWEE